MSCSDFFNAEASVFSSNRWWTSTICWSNFLLLFFFLKWMTFSLKQLARLQNVILYHFVHTKISTASKRLGHYSQSLLLLFLLVVCPEACSQAVFNLAWKGINAFCWQPTIKIWQPKLLWLLWWWLPAIICLATSLLKRDCGCKNVFGFVTSLHIDYLSSAKKIPRSSENLIWWPGRADRFPFLGSNTSYWIWWPWNRATTTLLLEYI